MMFAGWLRPHRVLMAVVTIGALACRDTTTPTEVSKAGIPDPSFTAAVGFVPTLVGRGNLGTFNIYSKAAGYKVDLKSRDNTDIAVSTIAVAPGGHSGWHFHPGPVLVIVQTGTITFYHGARSREDREGNDDREGANHHPTCSPEVHPAGTVFIEKGGEVGMARNEGAVEATVVATFFVPKGGPTRVDAPAPGNCPF